MKSKYKVLLSLVVMTALTACEQQPPQTNEQKVAETVSHVYGLNADERNMAAINGKQFFEKEWLPAGGKRGQLISCRPSDSNFNGLVTCTGFVPQANGEFAEIKRFCGYKADLVGCTDEDTVK
jgi:hypothetical protein